MVVVQNALGDSVTEFEALWWFICNLPKPCCHWNKELMVLA